MEIMAKQILLEINTKRALGLILFLIVFSVYGLAQESGNRAYGSQKRKPQINSGVLTGTDGKDPVYFIEANVLANVEADAFVAVFGVVQEGPTSAESNRKTDASISEFVNDLESLRVKRSDIFIDFIAQNKVYDYTASGSTVSEKFSGFETKKNVAVRYKDRELLADILSAAAKASIFDLIEVNYVVDNVANIHAKLYDEAVKVIKRKEDAYKGAFGLKMTAANVASEKYDAFYPGELYSGYKAFEAGNTYGRYEDRVVQQRKTSTFYYDPLSEGNFDTVVNQMGIKPMVQFTLYVKMQYQLR